MARGARVRLDTGIYQDAIGFSIVAKIGGEQREKRTATQPDQAQRRRWIEELTAKLPTDTTGTLAGDIIDYLKTLPAGPRKEDARNSLQPWRHLFGDRKRSTITSMEIRAALARWASEPDPHRKTRQKVCQPSTLNHRRQELSNVYTALNGRAGANPVRDVPRTRERRDEPRGIPPAIVRLILDEVPAGKTKLRLEVIAATGLPHVQIGRLHARDFSKDKRTLYVRPRRKGDGHPGVTLPLTKDATKALAAFFRATAEGKFSNSSVWKIFKAAVASARKKWQKAHRGQSWPAPEHLRPYDLRHSFLTEAYRRTSDLRAVAELALHADLRTTQRYAEAAVSETARKAVDVLDQKV